MKLSFALVSTVIALTASQAFAAQLDLRQVSNIQCEGDYAGRKLELEVNKLDATTDIGHALFSVVANDLDGALQTAVLKLEDYDARSLYLYDQNFDMNANIGSLFLSRHQNSEWIRASASIKGRDFRYWCLAK